MAATAAMPPPRGTGSGTPDGERGTSSFAPGRRTVAINGSNLAGIHVGGRRATNTNGHGNISPRTPLPAPPPPSDPTSGGAPRSASTSRREPSGVCITAGPLPTADSGGGVEGAATTDFLGDSNTSAWPNFLSAGAESTLQPGARYSTSGSGKMGPTGSSRRPSAGGSMSVTVSGIAAAAKRRCPSSSRKNKTASEQHAQGTSGSMASPRGGSGDLVPPLRVASASSAAFAAAASVDGVGIGEDRLFADDQPPFLAAASASSPTTTTATAATVATATNSATVASAASAASVSASAGAGSLPSPLPLAQTRALPSPGSENDDHSETESITDAALYGMDPLEPESEQGTNVGGITVGSGPATGSSAGTQAPSSRNSVSVASADAFLRNARWELRRQSNSGLAHGSREPAEGPSGTSIVARPTSRSPSPSRFKEDSSRAVETRDGQVMSKLAPWASKLLDEAQTRAAQRKFAEAIRSVIPVMQGPQRAADILSSLCIAWEQSDLEQLRTQESVLHSAVERKELEVAQERQRRVDADRRSLQLEARRDDEVRALMNELLGARERAEAWRSRYEDKDRELGKEALRRQEVERQMSWFQQRANLHDNALRENTLLKQQLQEAKAAAQAARSAAQAAGASRPSEQELAKMVADSECGPLRASRAGTEERLALKRKLLVKWHPDKQPSAEHVAFATQVMQEMQNRPEWK